MSDPRSCVLFLGQTGVCKYAVAETLDSEIAKTSASAGLSTPRWESFAFEDYLVDRTTIREFVQLQSQERQAKWRETAEALAESCLASDAPNRGIFLHGNYWYRGELFNHILVDSLARFRPTCVVTLIDDVYDIHTRILKREQEFDWGASELTLPQLVIWRWAEIGLGDLIARNVANHELPHFVVAVKHPAQMLRQLLLERQRLPVYASFPITKARQPTDGISNVNQEGLREEIREFRKQLRDAHYTVFDPLTIDEYRVSAGELMPRWPVDELKPMVPGEAKLARETEQQIRSSWSVMSQDIVTQVSRRDFRMIDGSDVVACYRPRAYDGVHSGGTREELSYGKLGGKGVVVVHHEDTDGGEYSQEDGPFAGGVSPAICNSTEDLLSHLERRQSERDRTWGDKPQEWTADS